MSESDEKRKAIKELAYSMHIHLNNRMKEEGKMFCKYCGNVLNEGAVFCSQCGHRVETEAKNVCPNCGYQGKPDELFCCVCGTRMSGADVVLPTPPVPDTPDPVPVTTGQLMLTMGMMSYYEGTPTVGFAKTTGTLQIYDDKVVLQKVLGNSLGAVGGLVGMGIASYKSKKSGSEIVWYFKDVRQVYEGRYGGAYHTIVLEMKNGQKHSFAGTLNSSKIRDAVELISRYVSH